MADDYVGGAIGSAGVWNAALNATYRVPDNVGNEIFWTGPDLTEFLQLMDSVPSVQEPDNKWIDQFESPMQRKTTVVTGCAAESGTPTLADASGILTGTGLLNVTRGDMSIASSVSGNVVTFLIRNIGDSTSAAWVAGDEILIGPVTLPENSDNGPIAAKGTNDRTLRMSTLWAGTGWARHEATRAKRGPSEPVRLNKQLIYRWKRDRELNLVHGYGGEENAATSQRYRLSTGLVQQIEANSAHFPYTGNYIPYSCMCDMYDSISQYGIQQAFLLLDRSTANQTARHIHEDFGDVTVDVKDLYRGVLGVDLRTFRIGNGQVSLVTSMDLDTNKYKMNGYMFPMTALSKHVFLPEGQAPNDKINPHVFREAHALFCCEGLAVKPKVTAWCSQAQS